jgi:hypothetical protein
MKLDYNVSNQMGIGHNLLFVDSASTNHEESGTFWLRKQIWGIRVMAGYASVCD